MSPTSSAAEAVGDPDGIPPEHVSRLGLMFYVDTNFVDDEAPAAEALRQLHRDGWINLQRTDTLDTELSDASDASKRDSLLRASSGYVESFGPVVVGHSRMGHALIGSEEDGARLDLAYRTLFPSPADPNQSARRATRKQRDAMHLATAIRYGCNGFITRDRDFHSKAVVIAATFDDFRVMTPEDASAFVRRVVARYEHRTG